MCIRDSTRNKNRFNELVSLLVNDFNSHAETRAKQVIGDITNEFLETQNRTIRRERERDERMRLLVGQDIKSLIERNERSRVRELVASYLVGIACGVLMMLLGG